MAASVPVLVLVLLGFASPSVVLGAPAPALQNPPAPGPGNRPPVNPQGPGPRGQVPPGAGVQGGGDRPSTNVIQEGDSYIFNFEEPPAGPAGAPESQYTVLTFVKECQRITGIPFYVKKEVLPKLQSANVTIIGTKTVAKAKFYDFFQSVLKINDFVLTLEGSPETGIWVITDLKGQDRMAIRNQARYIPPEDIPNYATQPGVLVATVIQVEHTNAREISASLRPFFPDNQLEVVTNVGNANALLVYGFGPTVNSISNLLKLIDTPPDDPKPVLEIIPLQHIAAEEAQQILDDLIEKRRTTPTAQGASGAVLQGQQPELKIRVEGHSNSLLVVGLEDDVRNVLEIVARIDRAQPEPESDFHVYACRNVKAEDLQKTVEEFINKSFQAQQSAGTGGTGGRAGGAGGAPTASSTREMKPVIVFDKDSNSVLVTANKTRWLELRDIIERLDRRQSQVLIECALIELSTNDAMKLGVELGIVNVPPAGSDISKGFGITSFGLSQLIDTDGDNFPDTRIPDNTLQGITGGIISGPDFSIPILIQAIKTVTNSNVLSVPSVLVNNNEHATVTSKDLVPTGNQTFSGANGSSNVAFSGYQDAGITLEITPSISAQSYLRLEFSLKVGTFVGSTSNPAFPPPKIEREVITTVYLPNESTMVVGGIRTDNEIEEKKSVPLLGDIPIIGWLFSSRSTEGNRRSLYFFATPHILSDVEFADLQNLTYQRKLEARTYIGDDRMKIVDPSFKPIEPGTDVESSALNAGMFEIPLYRSPRSGEVTPSEIGIQPPSKSAPPAPDPSKPKD